MNLEEPVSCSFQTEGCMETGPGAQAGALVIPIFFIFQIWPFLLEHLKVNFTSELIQIECPWRLFPIFPSLCKACLSKPSFQTLILAFPLSGFIYCTSIVPFLHNISKIICFLVIKNGTEKKKHPESSSEKYST